MIPKIGLLALVLTVSSVASAVELTIEGVPVGALAQTPRANAITTKYGRSTELKFEVDGTTYRISRGHELVLHRLKELQESLLANPALVSQAAENAAAIARIERAMADAGTGTLSTIDCSQSVDWVPYFRIWYNGTVSSSITWKMWPGPPAPWGVQVSASVYGNWAENGQWYFVSDGPYYGTHATTQSMPVQASAVTTGWSWQYINLYAYASLVSTDPAQGCEPLYLQASRSW